MNFQRAHLPMDMKAMFNNDELSCAVPFLAAFTLLATAACFMQVIHLLFGNIKFWKTKRNSAYGSLYSSISSQSFAKAYLLLWD